MPADPQETLEAIVIGSGFGGAVTACRLAQHGYDVLILERGRRYESHDFPALPIDEALLPDLRRWTFGDEQGLWDVLDLEELVSIQAAGYGGGSLIYANVMLRPPARVFDEPWPRVYRDRGALDEYFDLVGHMLEAKPITEHRKLAPQLVKRDQLAKAMKRLGRTAESFDPPLAITFEDGKNVHGREQRACTGCGSCSSGCPEKAKNTLDHNYLAVAEDNGARVRTQCEVSEIVQTATGEWVVECIDHLAGDRVSFKTPRLFLCAGSVHSTRLIHRTRLTDRAAERRLRSLAGVGYFPGGDALGVVFDTDHPQFPSVGPTITTTTVHWNDPEQGSFFLLQDGGYAEELERMLGMTAAPAWLGRNRLSRAREVLRAEREALRRSGKAIPPMEAAFATPLDETHGLAHALGHRGLGHAGERPKAEVLPSPLDALLDALANGDGHAALSEQLREAIPAFLDELGEPLMAPALVRDVIDRALDDAPMIVLWPRFLRPAAKWVARLVIRSILAKDETFAKLAVRALVTASHQSRDDIASGVFGYDRAGAKNRLMLLAMGRDAARGTLHYDRKNDRLLADLALDLLAPGYTREERLMTDVARALGGELRTNPGWEFLGKPVTVHNQGGCPMSEDPDHGVTDPNGRVHGCRGLYVMDGAILPTSVGVNPSMTIAALAERNVRHFLEHGAESKPHAPSAAYAEHLAGAGRWASRAKAERWTLEPPNPVPSKPPITPPLGLQFREWMDGYYSQVAAGEPPLEEALTDDARYREHEARGRPDRPIGVELDVKADDLKRFFEDEAHAMDLSGTIAGTWFDGAPLRSAVSGRLELLVDPWKPHGIDRRNGLRLAAHERFLPPRP